MPSNSETTVPFKDRPKVDVATQYGDTISEAGFWVEYPSGLVDLTRSHPLTAPSALVPPPDAALHLDIPCDADRTIRVDKASTAIVIVDMQNFFLHKDLRDHPKGLACVDPLLNLVPALRSQGIRIIWLYAQLIPIP